MTRGGDGTRSTHLDLVGQRARKDARHDKVSP